MCKTKSAKKAENILKLSSEEKISFLNSFDLVLSDCDGVVWMLSDSIPNTGSALMRLKQAGKQVKFISNNSCRNDEEYLTKLERIGVKDVKEGDIVHPVKTLSSYIKSKLPGQPIFSLCSDVMNESFHKNGVIVKAMKSLPSLDLKNIVDIIPTDKVAAVVVDIDFNLTYGKLIVAEQYLSKNPECQLLVGASDSVIPITNGLNIIGGGGFIEILKEATKKQPIVMGKPSPILASYLIELYNIEDPSRVLFIGDNLQMDIKFGLESGFKTLLVLSGATNMEKLHNTPEQDKPDFMANSLADFLPFFDEIQN